MSHNALEPATGAAPVATSMVPLLPPAAQISHLFESTYSLQWFVRKHKARLVEAGALLMHSGRWFVDLAKFEPAIRQIASEAARAQLAREPA